LKKSFGQNEILHKTSKDNDKMVKTEQHLTYRGNVLQGRHGWLRLTPAYSLSVVNSIIEHTGANPTDFVLDPFCGTGTTPLTCAMTGIPSHAVDINPFLIWFAGTKLSVFSEKEINACVKQGRSIAFELEKMKLDEYAWVPDIFQIDKWWAKTTLLVLANLFQCILSKKDSSIKNLLKIAFCRTMIHCAHVSFGHQSMSFKKKNNDLFNSLGDEQEVIASHFSESVKMIAEKTVEQNPVVEVKAFLGDSRSLSQALPRNDYSLVITSPPYPNRMSYIRELRPYMYWTGFLSDGRAAGELDWQAIGGTWGCATSMLNSWKPAEIIIPHFSQFHEMLHEIEKKQPTLSRYIHKYFSDMKIHIGELKKVLKRGGKCFYIVGNSKFYDTLVSVEEYFACLFKEEGFSNVTIEILRKRSSKKELFEYVVTAEWQ